MFITCITHADARDKKAHPFRGLTGTGWREVESSADRLKALIDEETPKIELVVSSPKARCVETAILLAKALSDLCATSEIQLDAGLKAGSISGNELSDLANRVQSQHVLISAHADIVRALPAGTRLIPSAAQNGWFTTRPVLILVKYDPGEPWAGAQVLACVGLSDDKWGNLLQG
jgi:phosphohistidine phosphatase SixA